MTRAADFLARFFLVPEVLISMCLIWLNEKNETPYEQEDLPFSAGVSCRNHSVRFCILRSIKMKALDEISSKPHSITTLKDLQVYN